MKNLRLIAAIELAGLKTQRELSVKTGINESIISRIINKRYIPTEEEKEKISEVLYQPVEQLFK